MSPTTASPHENRSRERSCLAGFKLGCVDIGNENRGFRIDGKRRKEL